MKTKIIALVVVNLLLAGAIATVAVNRKHPKAQVITPVPVVPVEKPIQFTIGNPKPSYMNYSQTIGRLREWSREASEITEVESYGTSKKGEDLYYLRICNPKIKNNKPCVLITACIHGNEPLASSTVMWWCGALLDGYCKDPNIKQLIDERDIYFVPVVSPDSYPHSRIVDGVDPNRNFPSPSKPDHKSVAPVAAIQKLFEKIKPNAVISGHTWGRVILTPYGDKMAYSENKDDYDRIIGQMTKQSGYRMMRTCDMYGVNGLNNPPIREDYGLPIYGSEVDWYYRSGAFAIVMEFGTHQRIPSDTDTKTEFDKTWSSLLTFIQEGPKVRIK